MGCEGPRCKDLLQPGATNAVGLADVAALCACIVPALGRACNPGRTFWCASMPEISVARCRPAVMPRDGAAARRRWHAAARCMSSNRRICTLIVLQPGSRQSLLAALPPALRYPQFRKTPFGMLRQDPQDLGPGELSAAWAGQKGYNGTWALWVACPRPGCCCCWLPQRGGAAGRRGLAAHLT